MRYENTIQYWVYNSYIRKIYINCNLFMNKQHLYYRKTFNNLDYLEIDYVKTNNAQFDDVNDFDKIEPTVSILPNVAFHLLEDKISQQS